MPLLGSQEAGQGSVLTAAGQPASAGSAGTVVQITDADSPYSVPDGVALVTCDTTAGSLNVVLPLAAANPGREITIRVRVGANFVDFDMQGGDTFDGGIISEPGIHDPDTVFQWVRVISDGVSSWWVASGCYFDAD